MKEKEQMILEMKALNDLLDIKSLRNDYAVYLKIKRLLELIIYRLDEFDGEK